MANLKARAGGDGGASALAMDGASLPPVIVYWCSRVTMLDWCGRPERLGWHTHTHKLGAQKWARGQDNALRGLFENEACARSPTRPHTLFG
jgi:hypothetical protein